MEKSKMAKMNLFKLALKVSAMRSSQALIRTFSAIPDRGQTMDDLRKQKDIVINTLAMEKDVDHVVSEILLADPNERNQLELTALQISQALKLLTDHEQCMPFSNRNLSLYQVNEARETILSVIEVLKAGYQVATGREAVSKNV